MIFIMHARCSPVAAARWGAIADAYASHTRLRTCGLLGRSWEGSAPSSASPSGARGLCSMRAKPKLSSLTISSAARRSSKVDSRNDAAPSEPCATPRSWQNASAATAPRAIALQQQHVWVSQVFVHKEHVANNMHLINSAGPCKVIMQDSCPAAASLAVHLQHASTEQTTRCKCRRNQQPCSPAAPQSIGL